MNANLQPLAQLNQKATEILVKEMGIVDAIRYLGQFTAGSGNYTEERKQWTDNLTLEEITAEIKASKEQNK